MRAGEACTDWMEVPLQSTNLEDPARDAIFPHRDVYTHP